jgi:hypothetical protein
MGLEKPRINLLWRQQLLLIEEERDQDEISPWQEVEEYREGTDVKVQ